MRHSVFKGDEHYPNSENSSNLFEGGTVVAG